MINAGPADNFGYPFFIPGLNMAYIDEFAKWPEEIKATVNEHADEFRSFEQMRRFARDLQRRS